METIKEITIIQQPKITEEEIIKTPVDPLKHIYILMKERMITEEEALTYNWTNIFYYYLHDKIKNGELIRIQIRGEVRTGKSTTGLKIKSEINKTLKKLLKNTNEIDEVATTLMDQTEFVRFALNPKKQICVQIDEYNTMAEGGANSTTEQQILQTYGDMFASEYVHTINCNPTQMKDTNAFIHLEVIGKGGEGENRFTRCKLIYVDNVANDYLTIGYIDIFVWDIIKNWETNVRPIFEKQKRTPKDEEYIKEQAKKDWFVKYQVKKEKRHQLLQKHHVRDVRELEFSTIVLATYEELKEIAELEDLKNDIIIAMIKDKCREQGRIYSMYAELEVLQKVKSIFTMQRARNKYKNISINAHMLKKRVEAGNSKAKVKVMQEEQIKEYIKAYQKFNLIFSKRLKEEKKLQELYNEYIQITG